jgi:hypothetical protein
MRPVHILAGVLFIAILFGGVAYLRRPVAADGNAQIEMDALKWYRAQNPGVQGLSAKYVNYGCHFEVDILQGGQRIARLGWNSPGNFYVLGR